MALDVGQKKTGVALTDPLEIIACPLTVFRHSQPPELLEFLEKAVQENRVHTIVVGVPYGNDGEMTKQGELVLQVARFLRKKMSKEIQWVFQEEILSSSEARQKLADSGAKRKKRRQPVDQFAAVQILQRYLDKREVK